MTAWCCLFCDGAILGQTVLVTGGAGAVGHYAVQLAKWGGARVIATVSSAMKAEQARLAGADLVINYRNEDVAAKAMAFTEGRGVDRVVDVDFGGNIATTFKMMAMNSTVAIYATNGNRNPVVAMRELMEKCIALRTLVLLCAAAAVAGGGAGRYFEMAGGRFAPAQRRRAIRAVGYCAGPSRGGERGQARHRHRRLRALSCHVARATWWRGLGSVNTGVMRSSVQVRPNASSPSAR